MITSWKKIAIFVNIADLITFSFANTNGSMYINLKPKYKVNELDHLNSQQWEEFYEQLMIILRDSFILYNLSEPKEIIYQTSTRSLMNKKPIFK